MAIKKDILDQLLAGRDPKDVFAKDGLLDDLKKAFAERTGSHSCRLCARWSPPESPEQTPSIVDMTI